MAYQAEIEKLEQRYAENPKQWFAALADAYRKQGEIDLAIEYVQGGIQDRPDYASAHIVLGRCYLDKDMDDDAARAFEQVLELDAENIIALKSLEEIAERRGDLGSARHWLNRLLEVDPMNEEAQECLERLGTADAEADAERVNTGEAEAMAAELGVDSAGSYEEGMPAEETPAPVGIEQTATEPALDPSSFDVEPIMLDSTMPLEAPPEYVGEDELTPSVEPLVLEEAEPIDMQWGAAAVADEPSGAFEPIEIEKEDTGPVSFFAEPDSEFGSIEPAEDTSGVLEPIEIENEDSDADALLASIPGDIDSADTAEEAVAELEPIDIVTSEFDVISLVPEAQGDEETWPEAGDAPSAIEPFELEPVSEDAGSLGTDDFEAVDGGELESEAVVPTEPVDSYLEPPVDEELTEVEEEFAEADVEEVLGEFEAAELDAPPAETKSQEEIVIEQRASVPPTKEVDAVDLEAMRRFDEAVSSPAFDSGGVEEPSIEAEVVEAEEEVEEQPTELTDETREEPVLVDVEAEFEPETAAGTTEIDAVELERLRAADAFAASTTEEAQPFEEPELDTEFAAEPTVEEAEVEEVFGEQVEAGTVTDEMAEEEPVAEEVVAEESAEEEEEDESDALPLIMPEDVGGDDTVADVEPEPVVTETMAEVYAKQGLLDQAVEIYEVLVMQHAGDERLKGRLDELVQQARSSAQESRQSRFSVAATGGESAVSYLQRTFSLRGDAAPGELDGGVSATALDEPPPEDYESEPTPMEEAFEDDALTPLGDPTVPAGDDVSLASVFDGGTPGSVSGVRPPEGEGEGAAGEGDGNGVSFDEFYGSEASPPQSEEGESNDGSSGADDDFKNWLDGLKT